MKSTLKVKIQKENFITISKFHEKCIVHSYPIISNKYFYKNLIYFINFFLNLLINFF
jgi:hypothetical protein